MLLVPVEAKIVSSISVPRPGVLDTTLKSGQ